MIETEFKEFEVGRIAKGSKICNIEDTSDETPPPEDNGSWTTCWKRLTSKERPAVCPVCGGKMTDETAAGAHIRFNSSKQDDWGWVTILCDSCNNWQNTGVMTLQDAISAVRIKMSKVRKSAL